MKRRGQNNHLTNAGQMYLDERSRAVNATHCARPKGIKIIQKAARSIFHKIKRIRLAMAVGYFLTISALIFITLITLGSI